MYIVGLKTIYYDCYSDNGQRLESFCYFITTSVKPGRFFSVKPSRIYHVGYSGVSSSIQTLIPTRSCYYSQVYILISIPYIADCYPFELGPSWLTHRVISDRVHRLLVTLSYFRPDRFVQLLSLIPILILLLYYLVSGCLTSLC